MIQQVERLSTEMVYKYKAKKTLCKNRFFNKKALCHDASKGFLKDLVD